MSTPSAVELAELAERFRVDVAWLCGSQDHREALPSGHAVIDQSLLDAFAKSETDGELSALLGREMSFGTIWVQIPPGSELVSVQEALRRVKEVDKRVRTVFPDLWQEWARVVLK